MTSPDKSRAINSSPTVLHGITWDHPRAYLPLEAASAEFDRSTGVKVVWDRRSLKDFGDQSIASMAIEFDLMVIDHPHVGAAVESQELIPLDEYLDLARILEMQRDSPGGSHASYYYRGHQWALAIDAACQVAAARSDLLVRTLRLPASITDFWPATWEAALARAELLRKHGIWLAMALCPTDCACSFLTLMAQAGTPLMESEGDLPLTEVVNVLTCLRKLASVAHPLSPSWNPIQLYDAMTSENEIAYCPLAFGYSNYADPQFCGMTLSFGPIPGRSGSLLGGAGIAVSRHTLEREHAVSFAAYLASAECQAATYLRSGGQPAHALAWRAEIVSQGSFFSGTLDTLKSSYTRPRNAKWPDFQPQLGELIHEFLTEGRDALITARHIHDRYLQCIPTR